VFIPKDPKGLSIKDRRAALEYLMFLKKKHCGKIKARGCADGQKQRAYLLKEETSSLMVSTEALFLTCVIDAEEGQDVTTVDVPGAFMHADMNKTVWVRLVGMMAELLIKIDPSKYGPYATYKRGKMVLYVCLKKALYRMLQAALLFWKLLLTKLQEWGYTINPYDWCVANKMIAGKQCMVAWHVDNLKFLHVSPDVVTGVIAQLNKEFGTLTPLTVT